MAKNHIQPGRVLTVPAPTGGVLSGAPVVIGSLFGVAQHDAAEGADVEILTEEVVELTKAAPLAIGIGDRLFWNGRRHIAHWAGFKRPALYAERFVPGVGSPPLSGHLGGHRDEPVRLHAPGRAPGPHPVHSDRLPALV